MSTTKKKPVALDATLKELVDAVRSQNAGQREQRDLLEMIANKLPSNSESEIYIVPVTCTTNDDGSFKYKPDGVEFDDILSAYEGGKFLIMRISYGENVYFATFVDFKVLTVPIGVSQTFDFFAHTLHDKQQMVTYYRMTQNDGTVGEPNLSAAPQGIAANQISCDVKVGEVECQTLDAALGAIVAALE